MLDLVYSGKWVIIISAQQVSKIRQPQSKLFSYAACGLDELRGADRQASIYVDGESTEVILDYEDMVFYAFGGESSGI